MNSHIFNASLAIGWVLLVCGVGLQFGWPIALIVGGTLLVLVTLMVARWAGVQMPLKNKSREHVPE